MDTKRNTVAFVTNQFGGRRIIAAAREIANKTDTNLQVIGIMDNEYSIDPEVVDYLFEQSKEHDATMRLIFREDSGEIMEEITSQYDCAAVVSGMPSSNTSIIYKLWENNPEKNFYTVDQQGQVVEVALSSLQKKAN